MAEHLVGGEMTYTCLGNNAVPSAVDVSNEITLGNSSVTKFRIPGIDVVLKDNGGTPTQGHVLTVDSNGEAGFSEASATITSETTLSVIVEPIPAILLSVITFA